MSDVVAPDLLEGPDDGVDIDPVNLPGQLQPPLAHSLLKQKRHFEGASRNKNSNLDNTTSDKENDPNTNGPHSSSTSRPPSKKFKPNSDLSFEQVKVENPSAQPSKSNPKKRLQFETM